LLKIKPALTASARIVGFTPGKGRLEGMVGAFVLDNGLKLSGMSDDIRANPPVIGTLVEYKYRELTRDGLPKEARFYRFL